MGIGIKVCGNGRRIQCHIKFNEAFRVLMLILNSYISDSQRVSVLGVAGYASNVADVATATNEQLIQAISYSSVASVVKQCEGKRLTESHLTANQGLATSGIHDNKYKKHNRTRMAKEHYERKTMKYPVNMDIGETNTVKMVLYQKELSQ